MTMNARCAHIIIMLLTVAFLNPSAVAAWTVPVPLDEVNTLYHDKSPFISYDGLTMYFSRQDGHDWHYTRMYQAKREGYDAMLVIEEIEAIILHHHHVDCPWDSPDNLRMYYYTTGPRDTHSIADRMPA